MIKIIMQIILFTINQFNISTLSKLSQIWFGYLQIEVHKQLHMLSIKNQTPLSFFPLFIN